MRLSILLLCRTSWSISAALEPAWTVRRFRARIAYDGSGFQGFQLQGKHCRTVQGCLEQVLSQRCNQQVRVVGSGRTDAGVHARGQAIHFDLSSLSPDDTFSTPKELEKFEDSLNKMLPPDVRLWNLQPAPPPILKTFQTVEKGLVTHEKLWHAGYDATKKLYTYRISLAPVMDPLERYRRWHPDTLKGTPVDPQVLGRLLKYYEGTHDFRAFAGSVEQIKKSSGKSLNTVRTVYSVDLVEEGCQSGNYRINIVLKGALYKQVRNMVGTALDAAKGIITEEEFRCFIQQDDGTTGDDGNNSIPKFTRKSIISKPAPPEGLTLEFVYFDNDEQGF